MSNYACAMFSANVRMAISHVCLLLELIVAISRLSAESQIAWYPWSEGLAGAAEPYGNRHGAVLFSASRCEQLLARINNSGVEPQSGSCYGLVWFSSDLVS
jgi:hypothetical protein